MAEPKFEKDLERLEAIVEALEDGGLSLDEALKTFEEGIKLAKRCEKALAQAEKRIEILTSAEDGSLDAEPFDPETAEEPARKPAGKKKPTAKVVSDDEREPDEPPLEDDGEELF